MAPKKVTTGTTTTKKAPTHPPFQEMIKEAIVNNGDRNGISRPAIKKYLLEKYNLQDTPSNNTNIATAIKRGEQKEIFNLPKGPSGKVKVNKAAAGKENKPTKSAKTASKGAAKPKAKSTTKKTSTEKKPLGKSTAANKATTSKPKAAAKKDSTKKAASSTTKSTKPAAPRKGAATTKAPAKPKASKPAAAPKK